MKKILYIGNKLSHHGYTKTGIETLGLQLQSEGYPLFYAGTKKNAALRLLEMIWTLIQLSPKVDFVLIDTYSTTGFWYAWLSAVWSRLLSVKYIPILRGGNLPARLNRSKWFCDRIFPQAHANVAVSGYLKHAFDKAGYPAIVIPNNIDISQYHFKQRDAFHPRLLWVRSFHRQYNPNMAAEVLALLLKDYPEAKLCMVGPDKDGSMQEFKNQCKKLRITDHVKITGLLSKPQWHRLSEKYDIFINTTNVDNTPVSVIEAMALGLPVVSTHVDGIPFLLDDKKDALLVSKNDAAGMYAETKKIIENTLVGNTISVNARTKAESFDWQTVSKQWKNLLK